MTAGYLRNFGNVDQTQSPEFFIRFLDAATADDSFQAYKRQTFALLEPRPGVQILDVACGTGDDARALAAMVGPTGKVVGVDRSEAMVDEARRRAEGSGLPVEFQPADALALPFPDGRFDACRCDRSFMHIPDPRQALAEMVRVVKPGSPVVVYEVDFETTTIDVPDRDVARRVIRVWCDGFRDGWQGRRVPNLFRDLGLDDLLIRPATLVMPYDGVANLMLGTETTRRAQAAGAVTAAEADAWLHQLEELHRADRFFATLTGFIVRGRKPGRATIP